MRRDVAHVPRARLPAAPLVAAELRESAPVLAAAARLFRVAGRGTCVRESRWVAFYVERNRRFVLITVCAVAVCTVI